MYKAKSLFSKRELAELPDETLYNLINTPLDPHRNYHPESDADHYATVEAAKLEAIRRGWAL